MTDRSSPTIYDVARLAGVSASTVSRSYSRPGRVATETSELIRASAVELGYRAHVVEAAAPQHTQVVALLVPDASSRFDAELIRCAGASATRAGYSLAVVLVAAKDEGCDQRVSLERVLPAVDGVIISASRMSDSAIRVIAKQRPTVVLNRVVADVPSVVRDNQNAMRLAVEHLAGLGHRSLTYVAGPSDSWGDGVRWRAVREAAIELGARTRRIGPFPASCAAGFQAAGELQALRTSAVIAFNDALAIGVMRGLEAGGLRVPADVSVIGVDNIDVAHLTTPSLTTVAVSVRAMCTAATNTLDALIRDETPTGDERVRVMPARLVVRGSTAQRRRKSTSPALGTTRVSGSAS
jgi:DNA-binding LacI/PurR family transcriptional regulator